MCHRTIRFDPPDVRNTEGYQTVANQTKKKNKLTKDGEAELQQSEADCRRDQTGCTAPCTLTASGLNHLGTPAQSHLLSYPSRMFNAQSVATELPVTCKCHQADEK